MNTTTDLQVIELFEKIEKLKGMLALATSENERFDLQQDIAEIRMHIFEL